VQERDRSHIGGSEFRGTRGQVGIGTLVAFIALVLVAAAASGVLVLTAEELQSRADATSGGTEERVSANLVSFDINGHLNDNASGVKNVTATVQLGPGSDAVDLGNATITLSTDTGLFASSMGERADGVEIIGGPVLRTDPGYDASTAEIRFQFDDGTNGIAAPGGSLPPGAEVKIRITMAPGAQKDIWFNIPDPIDPRYEGGERIRL
jgi:archaellin